MMTRETAIAIDNKIKALGYDGCRRFWYSINYAPGMNKFFERDYVRCLHSLFAGEAWDELNNLFLNYEA